jgi:hypothetical protein
MPTTQTQTQILLAAIGTWWRNWTNSRAALFEVESLGDAELARVADDAGLSASQLRTLAGKWPDSADLLSQRLAALQLDEAAVRQTEPGVLRDLERVCSLCREKPHCGHDIDRNPIDPEWRTYCPNVETLDALEAERSMRRLDHGHRT